MSRRSLALRIFVGLCLMVVLGIIVLPGRLWFGQREAIAQAEAQLRELKTEHAALDKRVGQLNSQDLIERRAHEDFGLVYPGDELYTLTPAPAPIVNLPAVWPFNRLQKTLADAAQP